MWKAQNVKGQVMLVTADKWVVLAAEGELFSLDEQHYCPHLCVKGVILWI